MLTVYGVAENKPEMKRNCSGKILPTHVKKKRASKHFAVTVANKLDAIS